MSNSNNNNNGKKNNNENKRNNKSQKKSKRSAAAIERRKAKWATQKAAKKAESIAQQKEKQNTRKAEENARKAEEERKAKSVLEMFPDIMGIVGAQGYMPNIKGVKVLSKTMANSLKQVPLFQNADRSTIYPNGMTILNKYLLERNWAEANKILDLGVSKKILDHPILYGSIPLMFAFEEEQYDFFVKLLAKGANPNIKIIGANGKSFYYLINYITTHHYNTPTKLLYIKALVERKVNIDTLDSFGYRPLDSAINMYDDDLAKGLIELGASVETPNEGGFTPVLTAIGKNNVEMLNYMIENCKINLDKQTGPNKLSPLKVATLNAKASTLEELLKHKLDLNQKDNLGNTALHYAVMTRNYDKILLLREAGADAKISNAKGNTAFELAKNTFGRMDQQNPKAKQAYNSLKDK